MYKEWSKEEEEYIKNSRYGDEKIAKVLGRSYSSIINKRHSLKIGRERKRRREWIIESIIKERGEEVEELRITLYIIKKERIRGYNISIDSIIRKGSSNRGKEISKEEEEWLEDSNNSISRRYKEIIEIILRRRNITDRYIKIFHNKKNKAYLRTSVISILSQTMSIDEMKEIYKEALKEIVYNIKEIKSKKIDNTK